MLNAACGWLGDAEIGDTSPQTILKAMAARLSVAKDAPCTIHVQPAIGLAGVGSSAPHDVYRDGGLCAAVCGIPRWSDPGLARHALQHGSAATVAAEYRRHGAQVLQSISGPFALIVLENDARTALLATDRMGVYPLAYAVHPNGALAFGSTATSIRAHPAFRSAIDPDAMYAYLYFHMVPSPLSIFTGQRKLLPGQYLWYRAGRAQLGFYWEPVFQDDGRAPTYELEEQLRTLLHTVVAHCRPDAATGAFLSGGIDSSTVAGMLTRLCPQSAHTFSIGFDAAGYDEMAWARISAQHFGSRQHEYYVTPADVAQAVPRIAQAYDEPFGNSSAVPVYYCAKLARDHGIDLMLAGDGGDELFGGNTRYAKQKVFELYQRVPPALRRRLIEPALAHAGRFAVGPVRKLRSYVEQARVPMPDRLETYNFLNRTPLADVLHPHLLGAVDAQQPNRLLGQTYGRARSGSLVNRMLFLDWKFTLADNDLRKVNRMCELAGINVRYPLLDDALVEFSTRVPANLKVKGTTLRYFFKHALRDFLPRAVLTKSKHGFGLPFGVWMRDYQPLQQLARESLERLGRRDYVRADYIERVIKLHREEHAAYYGEFLWVLMMLELWLEHHVDAPVGR